ncbi:platelet basic protein [Panthera tigris]|uniref:C-X-C motif chemokine n=1 Tax=Panthera tigris altaica TaxID=74533 RepID=A0A8C9KIQ5_PANTA|nr:platelet basic protein [Panthera tigris]
MRHHDRRLEAAIRPHTEASRTDSSLVSTMGLSPTSSCSSTSRLPVLQGLLLLSLFLSTLVPSGLTKSADVEPFIELRCLCMKTVSGIHPSNIQNLEVLRAGPHCANVEVIATLKNGNKVCLDPEAPKIKKIVQKILESSGSMA